MRNLATPVSPVGRSTGPVRVGSAGAVATLLNDGRLHLQHGPIDLIVAAAGEPTAIRAAYQAAGRRFSSILNELVEELPQLRTPIDERVYVRGVTAGRMYAAANRFREWFITPMAAVAGSVAEEILTCMRAAAELKRVYVNNGGDIALWLSGDEEFRIGVIPEIGAPLFQRAPMSVSITADSCVGGIATSGWRGRSQSLGIADSVTVFADGAAVADAAATLIANAVDIDSDKIARQAANEREPDSDLGPRPTTIAVGELTAREAQEALSAGVERAEEMCARSQIIACAIFVQDRFASVGDLVG